MPLQVVVELHIRAITCPGVFLPEKKGLLLSVCILDQYRETKCFPAVFPVMINEVMKFDKIFVNALDPATVAELLETYMIRFELIQLIPPEGTLLAYYEKNTRDFLFPEPRLTPLYPGVDREVLMKTLLGFPGISPKIEFSTRTAIKELTCPLKRFFEERLRHLRPASASCFKQVLSPHLQNLRTTMKENACEKLGRSFRSRSPSPHMIRRLCQEERPLRPNPGSRGFKPRPETKPPFVVRHVDSSKPFGEQIPLKPHTQKSRKNADFACFDFPLKRASSLDSIAVDMKILRDQAEWTARRRELLSPSSDRFGNISSGHGNQGDSSVDHSTSFAVNQHRSASPHLYCLHQRRCCSPHFTWEKIHERVWDHLTSQKARQRLYLGVTESEVEDIFGRRTPCLRRSPLHKPFERRHF
ncbi:spermatogenesis associated 6-like protein isoform X2 [Vombatus ursinus]|uniref:spermatogenesis associated 6-like protein isoform X2 n=1 Tax=Vombatus ursinus TaxID=29139 RepID=UPI000FFCF373|nr:spermatogenesis associated 6-like protein isoform X2 [Vombatus ursinus]